MVIHRDATISTSTPTKFNLTCQFPANGRMPRWHGNGNEWRESAHSGRHLGSYSKFHSRSRTKKRRHFYSERKLAWVLFGTWTSDDDEQAPWTFCGWKEVFEESEGVMEWVSEKKSETEKYRQTDWQTQTRSIMASARKRERDRFTHREKIVSISFSYPYLLLLCRPTK